MRRVIVVVCVLAMAILPRVAQAQWAVLDVANLLEAGLARIEAEAIRLNNVEQLITLIDQLQEFREQYNDLKQNWQAMAIDRLILRLQRGLDRRLGYSALNLHQHLDPSSSRWRRDAENLLRLHYDLPDMTDLQREVAGAYGNNRGPVVAALLSMDRSRIPQLDGYHFQAAQERATEERLAGLERLQDTFSGLREKSETKQLQSIGALLALQARQNEATLDALQLLATQQQQDTLQRQSEHYRLKRAELARVRAARRPFVPPCTTNCLARW